MTAAPNPTAAVAREMLAVALYGQWRAGSLLTANPEPSYANTTFETRQRWRVIAENLYEEFTA